MRCIDPANVRGIPVLSAMPMVMGAAMPLIVAAVLANMVACPTANIAPALIE